MSHNRISWLSGARVCWLLAAVSSEVISSFYSLRFARRTSGVCELEGDYICRPTQAKWCEAQDHHASKSKACLHGRLQLQPCNFDRPAAMQQPSAQMSIGREILREEQGVVQASLTRNIADQLFPILAKRSNLLPSRAKTANSNRSGRLRDNWRLRFAAAGRKPQAKSSNTSGCKHAAQPNTFTNIRNIAIVALQPCHFDRTAAMQPPTAQVNWPRD